MNVIDFKSGLSDYFNTKTALCLKLFQQYFLGLQIARFPEEISLSQTKYIYDILADTGLQTAKSATSHLPQGVKFSRDAGSPLSDPEPYRRLVGGLLYIGFTRPDIAHGVQQLTQFLQHPCDTH
ncbi:UNVERIFIED_CONTAM: hypothetical protein Scaly_0600600 [Sesamum calycinum]|uniref:Reverse transcriptase Ty1/copia-type domain-containing protein n=1 Tax=Sesamum calycinum TaxID=2727403 RepID=A0AAW2RUK4_9LAMI